MEAHVTPSWVLLAYLISGICFILALRGLSSPDSSRRGNLIGMAGMAIAVVTTLITHFPGSTYPPSPGPGHDSVPQRRVSQKYTAVNTARNAASIRLSAAAIP